VSRVIRVEDGSLQELTHALADAIGKHKLVKNTVILMGSLSHFSNAGTEHYLMDWVRSTVERGKSEHLNRFDLK
jgi:hypothetical protein